MNWKIAGFIVIAVAALAGQAHAHHSFAMFDHEKMITVSGSLKEFEWTNPHAHIYIETKDEKGNTVVWDCEMMSLNYFRSYN